MKDFSLDIRAAAQTIDSVLPETLAEAEKLAAMIERAVQRQTSGAIRHLAVEVDADGCIMLRGRSPTYFYKQLAQHAAMAVPGHHRLANEIEVD